MSNLIDIAKENVQNPYEGTGLPYENWQRGYDGLRFIGARFSDAHIFYSQGVKARKSIDKNGDKSK